MIQILISVLAFVITIGFLVGFHEFGHFITAHVLGIRVLRFSIGFGRPLLQRTIGKDQIEFQVAAIPLGGYVKMLDEREGPVAADELDRAFNRQPLWKRVLVVGAGPFFNLFLAVFLYGLTFMIGVPGLKPVISEPPPDTLAAEAGLLEQDLLVAIGDRATPTWEQATMALLEQVLHRRAVVLTVENKQGEIRQVALELHDYESRLEDPSSLLHNLGFQQYIPLIPPVIDEVLTGQAADRAGIKSGDRIMTMDGEPVLGWREVVKSIGTHPDQSLSLEIERSGQRHQLTLTPENQDGTGMAGISVRIPENLLEPWIVIVRYPPWTAAWNGIVKTWDMGALTLQMMGRMLIGEVSVKNVGGPIQIAQFAGYSVNAGVIASLSFLAIVSLSLGVLNLLPVPVLDGGHLLVYAVEGIMRRPLPPLWESMAQRLGLTLLLMLMVLAFYNDLHRVFG